MQLQVSHALNKVEQSQNSFILILRYFRLLLLRINLHHELLEGVVDSLFLRG
jgi:hypothetical protein